MLLWIDNTTDNITRHFHNFRIFSDGVYSVALMYRHNVSFWSVSYPLQKMTILQSSKQKYVTLMFLLYEVESKHYSDVTRAPWLLKSPASPQFIQLFAQTYITEDSKALRYWKFVRGIYQWPVGFPHNAPVARKLSPSHHVIRNEERRKSNSRRSWGYRLFPIERDNLIKSGWISIQDNHHMPWFR